MNYSYGSALFGKPKQIKHVFDPDFKQWHQALGSEARGIEAAMARFYCSGAG